MRTNVSFAAIDRYIDKNIVLPTERMADKEIVSWGDGNAYPDYLLDLYRNAPTLRSIINGNVDFVCGDDITFNRPMRNGWMNRKRETIRDIVKGIARDFEIYGGYALQIIRNYAGDVCEVYRVDMRFLRTNKEGDVFWYCEEFSDHSKRKHKARVYPAYMPDLDWSKMDEDARQAHASSIVYVKNEDSQVYPAPVYAASVKACEIERCIDDYHLNAINNDFTPSIVINFNNGEPDDDIREEIEDSINERFSGHSNGGRILCSWNKDKESATTFESVDVADFGARYDALSKHSRQQIFTAFRAVPALFGINPENNGFSKEEYDSAFRLYNRTQIQPLQKLICETFEKVFGEADVVTFVPFSLGEDEKPVEPAPQVEPLPDVETPENEIENE